MMRAELMKWKTKTQKKISAKTKVSLFKRHTGKLGASLIKIKQSHSHFKRYTGKLGASLIKIKAKSLTQR